MRDRLLYAISSTALPGLVGYPIGVTIHDGWAAAVPWYGLAAGGLLWWWAEHRNRHARRTLDGVDTTLAGLVDALDSDDLDAVETALPAAREVLHRPTPEHYGDEAADQATLHAAMGEDAGRDLQ